MPYNPRKAAQVIAYFTMQNAGEIHVLKAIKLVYLADRESVRARGHTMHQEPRFSLHHGPINSTTLDHVNGDYASNQPTWQEYLDARAGRSPKIGLSNKALAIDDLDELSVRELQILEAVWQEHGHKDRFELAQWTHDNLVEWEDPNGSRLPITLASMMAAVGLDRPIERSREQESLDQAHNILASL